MKRIPIVLLLGSCLTLVSLLVVRPIKSSDVCGVLICTDGSATYAEERSFPLSISRGPSDATQPGDIDENTTPKIFWINTFLNLVIWSGISLASIELYTRASHK